MVFRSANSLENSKPIELRQHEVEDNEVITTIPGQRQADFTVLCAIHGEARPLTQRRGYVFGQAKLILYDQYSHGKIINPANEGTLKAGRSKRLRSTLNGQRFGLHNLRHSVSTWLVNKGKIDPKTVQGMLRHSDIRTTMNLYTQDDRDEKQAAQGAFLNAAGLGRRLVQ